MRETEDFLRPSKFNFWNMRATETPNDFDYLKRRGMLGEGYVVGGTS